MKKIVLAFAGAALLAGSASAANLTIIAHHGESLATISQTDDDNDDNDGLYFLDHYTDYTQAYSPYHNVLLSGENQWGGAEIQLKYEQKKMLQMTYLNAWLNFNNPFGAPGTLTVKYGRFDAYPVVDFVGDACRGAHYSGYAVNSLMPKAGFDPQTMSWFLANQGFVHSNHSRVAASYGKYTTADDGTVSVTGNWGPTAMGALSSFNWFFNDMNNAGANITYASTYYGMHTSLMLQYAPNDDLIFRFAAKEGSASNLAATYAHDFYGQKTFTNWNAQVSAKVGDIAKLGLTVKMSDMLSGAYVQGSGLWESAGTDLNASLAVSSDSLVDGLRLFASYGFAGVYLGMYGDVGTKKDLSETYLFHAIDLRAVYDVNEQLSVGLNTNISMVNQSEYYQEVNKDANDLLGFNVGLSASYALSDVLAIDLSTGFRCLDVNNEVGVDRKTGATGKGDMLAVSSFGIEPSIVFTLSKNASLSIGVNLLLQNLSSEDVYVNTWQANNMANYGNYYPMSTTVTLPLYMFIRI